AKKMVQVTSDAKPRLTITALTTTSAERNIDHGDKSRGMCPVFASGRTVSFAGGTVAAGCVSRGESAGRASAGRLAAGGGAGAGVCADAGSAKQLSASPRKRPRAFRKHEIVIRRPSSE